MAYLMRPAYNICKEFRTPSPGKVAGRSQRLLQCSAQRQGGERPPPPSNPSYSVTRRAITLQSFGLAFIGTEAFDNDSRTVINSVLGAYGLPQMAAAKGLRPFDDFDLEYAFSYPKSWVRRRNSLREGIYISDFNTADKLSVETFPVEGSDGNGVASEAFALRVVGTLLNPGAQAGGDSRIELPPTSRIKSEVREIDGKEYLYLAFPSETITRSGYQVRRKNVAVAAVKRGVAYCLGTSARSDQWNAEKEQLLTAVVESFRLR